ncbi:MAG: hypothetical protein R3282_02510 [Rhodothermales bacterium]|nr:hypothetical protein [Rhodothermales bacterium]
MIPSRRRYVAYPLALALVAVIWAGCSDSLTDAEFEESTLDDALVQQLSSQVLVKTGNYAPSGPHYNLNLIGVPKDKSAAMDGNNGHRIFVKLEGNTKILLAEGDDFAVLDANGTDGNGAKFQLPNPDPDNDGITVYSVYARALGKPGGNGTLTPCATYDPDPTVDGDEEEVCSMTALYVERTKGRQKFSNVSKYLLYVYVDLDGDGTVERYNLFNDALQDYLWSYDNNGLKLLQLRFYEIPTDIND